MKKILLLFALCVSSTIVFCQDEEEEDGPARPPTKNAQQIYGEFGGNGLLFTANYDFRFNQRQKGLGMRMGLGFFGGTGGGILTVPVALNYLSGRAPNYLEVGFGATYANFTADDDFFENSEGSFFLVPSIGYRYQPRNKGFTGRIFVSPLIVPDVGVITWGGISAGYRF